MRATLETVSCGELTAVYRKDSDTGIVELASWIVDASSVCDMIGGDGINDESTKRHRLPLRNIARISRSVLALRMRVC